MKALFLLPLLLMFASPVQQGADEGAPLLVVSLKWSKSRQTVVNADNAPVPPAQEVTPAIKNYERNRRSLDPRLRDPSEGTVDARAAALEKSVQEARSPRTRPVDGYAYRVKVKNGAAKVIDIVFWEYQFTELSDPSHVSRRQFLCGVQIGPSKEKELQAFGLAGPGDVIDAQSLGKPGSLFSEKVVINRLEYADGSVWQRRGWSYADMKPAIERAVATPWGQEMCRGL